MDRTPCIFRSVLGASIERHVHRPVVLPVFLTNGHRYTGSDIAACAHHTTLGVMLYEAGMLLADLLSSWS